MKHLNILFVVVMFSGTTITAVKPCCLKINLIKSVNTREITLSKSSELQLILIGDSTAKDSTRKKINKSSNNLPDNLFNNAACAPVFLVGLLTAAAIVVSNDFSVHHVYSFSNQKLAGQNIDLMNTNGFSLGLRKIFKNSAIEFGGTIFQPATIEIGSYFSSLKIRNVYGLHFNYVHQIFYNKTPQRLKFYSGPSVNYMKTIGYGGIAGAEFKLFERLKLDLRYELTTQTNQLQAGVFFTYQKKSPWEK